MLAQKSMTDARRLEWRDAMFNNAQEFCDCKNKPCEYCRYAGDSLLEAMFAAGL